MSRRTRRSIVAVAVGALLIAMFPVIRAGWNWLEARERDRLPEDVTGQVLEDGRPVEGAFVSFPEFGIQTKTNAAGRFTLRRPIKAESYCVGHDGCQIIQKHVEQRPAEINMQRMSHLDSTPSKWIAPADVTPDKIYKSRPHYCADCHGSIYDEWRTSGHGQATARREFQQLYFGTDAKGRRAGWSLTHEHPEGAGVCAACHAPTNDQLQLEPTIRDVDIQHPGLSGVHCDYCHKVAGPAEGTIGLTLGRFGLRTASDADEMLFFGPLPDSTRTDSVYSTFQNSSRLCASCHEGTVFGVAAYTTYSEWQASPAGKAGIQCQNCHMKPTGTMTNIAPGHGGVTRDPMTLGNHSFFDGSREAMLKKSLRLDASVNRGDGGVETTIQLRVEGVGHRVPTGFVDKHLVMTVTAIDATGRCLIPLAGPTIPAWAGDDIGGRPGKLYAKQLTGLNGVRPSPFWRAESTMIDTRLEPGKTDSTTWQFPASTVEIGVVVRHRRFWGDVASEKGWIGIETPLIERVWTVK